MSDEARIQLQNQFVTAQYKYAYFILTAAGAGIALAISGTSTVNLAYSQIALGCAVLSWGISFYSGCRFVLDVNSSLYSNLQLLVIAQGLHPATGTDPILQNMLTEGILEDIEKQADKTERRGARQFRFLVFGAVLYLAWHMLEMLLRTLAANNADASTFDLLRQGARVLE